MAYAVDPLTPKWEGLPLSKDGEPCAVQEKLKKLL